MNKKNNKNLGAEEPDALQKLRKSSTLSLTLEGSCFTAWYAASCNEGTLFRTKGTYAKYYMYDGGKHMVMSTQFKYRMFSTSHMEVNLMNYPPLKVVEKGGRSSSLLVQDEKDQTRLKIRPPPLFGYEEYSVLGADDIPIGILKKDWNDWELTFPEDLDVSYKASLISACIFLDILAGPHAARP